MYQKSKHLKHKEFEPLTWSGAGCWHILHPFPLKNTTDEYLNCNNIWKNICMKLQKKKSHNKSQKSNTTDCAQILAKKTNSAETPGTHFYRWFSFDGLILKTHFEWVNEHCSLISQMSQHSSSSQKVSNNSMTQSHISMRHKVSEVQEMSSRNCFTRSYNHLWFRTYHYMYSKVVEFH